MSTLVIQSAEFRGSFPSVQQAPLDERPEFAFIGRSNVGKSSLINMLVERKELARTSNKPGKTQHLNYYLINEQWYLVDLPGYGFARAPKKVRRTWGTMIDTYLLKRDTLVCTFVLIDSHVPPQRIDLEFINWLGEHGLPFALVYTKADRQKEEITQENLDAFRAAMLEHWEALPPEFVTSSVKQWGREEIGGFISRTLTDISSQ